MYRPSSLCYLSKKKVVSFGVIWASYCRVSLLLLNLKINSGTTSQDTVFIEMPTLNISFELGGIELPTSRRPECVRCQAHQFC